MIPPIPKMLLVHSAELITRYNADKWGNAAECDRASLKNVRIEPASKSVTDTSGTVIQLSATLIYDCRNSAPRGVVFALTGDKTCGKTVEVQQVVFGGRTFTVKVIDTLYADADRIHHYEVGLA